jgi:predicted nuclease of predicted toxin-antitoxin system
MIKVKVDECLPEECAELLLGKGYDVDTVRHEGLQGAADAAIWKAAQDEKRLLVTTDLDFSDVRRYEPGKHAGVLLLRLAREEKECLRSPGATARVASFSITVISTKDHPRSPRATWSAPDGCRIIGHS